MLTELRDWAVTAQANGEVKVVADFPQAQIEDVLKLVWKLAETKHPGIDPEAWVFTCHAHDGGRPRVFRIAADGRTGVPYEAIPNALPVGRA
jgi:hypothetical protein